MLLLCFARFSYAEDAYPKLYYVARLPQTQRATLVKKGFDMDRVKSVIAWDSGGTRHYFVAANDVGGGCNVIEIDDAGTYKTLDSYGQCKIIGAPQIADLMDDRSRGVVVRLQVNASGETPSRVEQVNGYLYVNSASEFCRNNDAGSFAGGTRVSNSVLAFSSSICR